jgi:uncharacterized protein YbjQ (UPF0145 family)
MRTQLSCSTSIPHGFSSTKFSGIPPYQTLGEVKEQRCTSSSIIGKMSEARYDEMYSAAQSKAKSMGGDAIINYQIIKTDYLISPVFNKDCYMIVGTAVKFISKTEETR